jgi:hypothetical protein
LEEKGVVVRGDFLKQLMIDLISISWRMGSTARRKGGI